LDHLDIEGGEAAIRFTYGASAEVPAEEGPVAYITLEDSVIHGSEYSAVDCTPGPCNHMSVRRTEIYGTGIVGQSFYGSDGLEFARGYPVLVEDCYIHDNGGDGIDLNSRDRAGNASGVIVRRNRVIGNHLNGIKLWAGGRMENNVVWGQGESAVWVGTFTSTLEVINNTVAYNMWDDSYSDRNWAFVAGYPEEVLPYPPVNLTLVNNIFAFNTGPDVGGPTGIYLGEGVQLTEHHNLYYSREDGEITAEFVDGRDPDFTRTEIQDGTWTIHSGQGQDDLTLPPLFSSGWPAVDLHLQEGSPAIDAGTQGGAPADDVDGRPRDEQPDIGAYERWEPTAWMYLPLTLRGWSGSRPQPAPDVAGCRVFPADNAWNTPVDALPVDANSDAYVAAIGADAYLHADFGSGEWPPGSGSPIGIPYVDVPGTQATVPVSFTYEDESDPGPYPIPPDSPIEGGPDSDGDRHVLILDRDSCKLYELFYARPRDGGRFWEAGSGAIFDLSSHTLRPETWTSADAAGLPILPGLVRYDEVAAGEIRHAIRFTALRTRRGYVWPARHFASDLTGEQYPPMGQRFRLRADVDISDFSTEVQVILRALKTYGMMLADNGAPWFISGVPDERWDNDVLHELHRIRGSAFEAVDVSSLMLDPDSGQASQRSE
jgi:hypothetical protein